MTYYNEVDPFAADWLRRLISAGHLPQGVVDERDIRDISPAELAQYEQCHFFAGIGGWPLALRQSGWPDDRPVWTGSCPCQPFSGAGQGGGFADERHLWPFWHFLIEDRAPLVIFGEQVSGGDGLTWFELVQADLEAGGYEVGGLDIPASSVGAPHRRHRLYWVADSGRERGPGRPSVIAGRSAEASKAGQSAHPRERRSSSELAEPAGLGRRGGRDGGQAKRGRKVQAKRRGSPGVMADADSLGRPEGSGGRGNGQVTGNGGVSGVADTDGDGLHRKKGYEAEPGGVRPDNGVLIRNSTGGGLADTDGDGREVVIGDKPGVESRADSDRRGEVMRPGPANGFWRDSDWLLCSDLKWRAVEPGTFPLASGVPARVGQLRAYGNAIVIPQAVKLIESYLAVRGEQ